MFLRDSRTFGMHDLINQADQQKYHDAFDTHAFEDMAAVISWLLDQATLMAKKKFANAPTFERAAGAADLKSKLDTGDQFFCRLFEDRSQLPFSGVATKNQPLTNAVETLYESIWNLPTTCDNSTIDGMMLGRYIESKLGNAAATDQRLSKPKYWVKLIERLSQSSSFYHGFLDNIPHGLIESFDADLQFPTDRKNVLQEVYYIDKRVTNTEFHLAYENQMVKLETSSPWKFVKALTDRAEYAHFSSEWSFKEDLILRLPVTKWVDWIDKLYWPFTQAIWFFSVRDLVKMEEFFEELAKSAKTLATPYPHLTLIALHHYFHRLIHEITRNLHHTSQDTSPAREDVRSTIRAEATRQHDGWKTTDRKNSLVKVFDSIFADPCLVTLPLLRGIFDWVADQDQGTWSLSPSGNITAPDIKDLYEVFLGKVEKDARLRSDLLRAIQSDELTWSKTELLFSIYLQDETDVSLRNGIVDKMLAWLKSETFSWNHGLEYNNVVFNQACRLAYLICRGPDPETTINTIIEKFRYWHEGWPTRLPRSINQSKELYTIIVGIFVCYNYFGDGDRVAGERLFDRYLLLVLDQYRQAMSGDRKKYCLAIHLLIHVHLKFALPNFPNFMNELAQKVDNIEEILQVAHDWIETAGFLKSPFDASIASTFLARIDADYWIIEMENKFTRNPSPFKVYETMHTKIESAFRPLVK